MNGTYFLLIHLIIVNIPTENLVRLSPEVRRGVRGGDPHAGCLRFGILADKGEIAHPRTARPTHTHAP